MENGQYQIGLIAERTRAYGRSLCEGVAAFAQECGNWAIVPVDDDGDLSVARLKRLDGFIARLLDEDLVSLLEESGKPVVDVFYRKSRPRVAVVDTDHAAVARMAAEHFLSRHFTSFAYCGYDGVRFSDARREAFVQTLSKRGFQCKCYMSPTSAIKRFEDDVIRHERIGADSDNASIKKFLLSLPPHTAVFCCHDRRAYQVLRICRTAKIEVPKDLAILGVDNDSLLCSFVSPMLSSIEPDAFHVGYESAKLLQQMIDSPALRKKPPKIFIPPKDVAVRASSEVYPLDPPWLSDALVFIKRNVSKRLSASDVFERIGLSHTLVEGAFRSVLDTTVQKEIMQSRLDEAKHLLETTDLPVVELSKLSGFSSPQYFCRSFSAANKISPDAYRKRYKEECENARTIED